MRCKLLVILFSAATVSCSPNSGKSTTLQEKVTIQEQVDEHSDSNPLFELHNRLKQFEKEKRLNDYDYATVSERIVEMGRVDDDARELLGLAQEYKAKKKIDDKVMKDIIVTVRELDIGNANELQIFIDKYGWIDSKRFGKKASYYSWLIIQHMVHDGGEFQRRMLEVMQPLALEKKVRPQDYAMLNDRVKVLFDKSMQDYGTQGQCKQGIWEPAPIKNRDKLHKRRVDMQLPLFSEQQKQMDAICSRRD